MENLNNLKFNSLILTFKVKVIFNKESHQNLVKILNLMNNNKKKILKVNKKNKFFKKFNVKIN